MYDACSRVIDKFTELLQGKLEGFHFKNSSRQRGPISKLRKPAGLFGTPNMNSIEKVSE